MKEMKMKKVLAAGALFAAGFACVALVGVGARGRAPYGGEHRTRSALAAWRW